MLPLTAGAERDGSPDVRSTPADSLGPGSGMLRILDADGRPAAAFPLKHTEVHAEVAGSIARVVVEQEFQNPYVRSIEAVYVFPLPHASAVDDLEMRIGERIVRGEIRTRQAAREIYERAKEQGQLAALLDQERPNIFTQQVANIQPGHAIVVRIRYVESLEYRDGAYEMVFPTVVGPRFIPGRPLGDVGVTPASVQEVGDDDVPADRRSGSGPSGTGWAQDTDRVPDASRITPPVVPPGRRAGHDIQITVDLDAGVPLRDLECPSHVVDVEKLGPSRSRVRLRPSDTIPNKDFVLRYRVAGEAPEFGFLAHREASGFGYFSLALQPEARVTAREARPKEMIFLLDTSGSMRGEPMARSKAAMRWALQHLGPDDTFLVIRFSDQTSSFAPLPVACTPANVQRGLTYVEQLEGEGGTQMLSGILAALRLPSDPERLRIVCLLTDGYIGNETEILGAVRQEIGDARLFSFGVGSSVNRYLLDELAEEGRGSVDYVPLDGETRPIVERFYDRIAKPYLTDIAIDWSGLDVQGVYPARLPDLFAGQPLVLAGRYQRPGRGEIVVRGKLGRAPFERRLRVELPASAPDHAALGTLWARRRIDALEQRMVRGDDPALVRETTDLALAFRLMTRFTSFVAVDNQTVSKDGTPRLVPQPVEMPAGVSYEGVFGAAGEPRQGAAFSSRGLGMMGGQLHVRGGRAHEAAGAALNLPPRAAMPAPAAPVPPAAVRVTGRAKQVDVKSSDAGHASATRRPGAAAAKLEVRIEPETGDVLAGERVRLRVTVRNAGSESVDVPEFLTAEHVALRLVRDGKEVAGPKLVADWPWSTTVLAPGATRTYRLVLDAATAELSQPGRYRLELAGIGPVALAAPHPHCSFRVR